MKHPAYNRPFRARIRVPHEHTPQGGPMNNMLCIVLLFAAVSAVCFAPSNSPAASTGTPRAAIRTTTGTIAAIAPANPAQGSKAYIAIVTDSGIKTIYYVKTTALLVDLQERNVPFAQFAQGQKVKVTYCGNEMRELQLIK